MFWLLYDYYNPNWIVEPLYKLLGNINIFPHAYTYLNYFIISHSHKSDLNSLFHVQADLNLKIKFSIWIYVNLYVNFYMLNILISIFRKNIRV